MKFTVTGNIKGKTQFSIEIEAESEEHARALTLTRIGSAQGISKSNIIIGRVEKVASNARTK
ncbi:MAG: hypothetical protein QXW10_00815 [Candidatus Micrarchaeaceae archaeon]